MIEAYRTQSEHGVTPKQQLRLSEKEMMIIGGVTQGLKNKDIALEVGTTEQVVKNYLRKIYDKLGVSIAWNWRFIACTVACSTVMSPRMATTSHRRRMTPPRSRKRRILPATVRATAALDRSKGFSSSIQTIPKCLRRRGVLPNASQLRLGFTKAERYNTWFQKVLHSVKAPIGLS